MFEPIFTNIKYIIMININLFKSFWDKQPFPARLKSIYETIKADPALRERTEKFRTFQRQENKFRADQEKQACPAFTPAARFDKCRTRQNIIEYTNLTLCDFDHIPPERMDEAARLVACDPHSLLAYRTISGLGLRVICRFELPDHDVLDPAAKRSIDLYQQAFFQVNEYYAGRLGLDYDKACKNPERISGLAYDPRAHYNPAATPFRIDAETVGNKPLPSGRPVGGKLAIALRRIKGILEGEGLSYGPGHHNEYIMRVGYMLNRYGISKRKATEWAISAFADYGEAQVRSIMRSCYQQTDEHATRPTRGNRAPTFDEIEATINELAETRRNNLLNQLEIRWQTERDFHTLDDRDLSTLWSQINKRLGTVRINVVDDLLRSDFVPLFNPFQDYLDRLPTWDGTTDHIANLANRVRIKGDQELFVRFFRKWFVAILPTALDETVVNHQILVLVGRQGIYKTTWLNHLLPLELRRYFYTKTNSDRYNKDDKLVLAESLMVCLEELDYMRPAELNQLKALVTSPHINERAAYARHKEHRPHTASLCGTGNNPQFLTDPTGNRRWLAFEVESILNPYDNPIDYEGLYAQALSLWKSGFRYWFDESESDELTAHNEYFEAPNLEEELIRIYFRHPLPGEAGEFITVAQILERINAYIKKPLKNNQIGFIMTKLNFKAVRKDRLRGYIVVINTRDDIERISKSFALNL